MTPADISPSTLSGLCFPWMPVCTRAHMHTRMHTRVHTRIHTRTHSHAHTQNTRLRRALDRRWFRPRFLSCRPGAPSACSRVLAAAAARLAAVPSEPPAVTPVTSDSLRNVFTRTRGHLSRASSQMWAGWDNGCARLKRFSARCGRSGWGPLRAGAPPSGPQRCCRVCPMGRAW